MAKLSTTRAVVLGLSLAFAATLAWRIVRHAPEIVVSWGNAIAERERRLAAEAARQAEAEKADSIQRAADGDYNEAHCKVIIVTGSWGEKQEIITHVRRISPDGVGYASIYFGGGVEKYVHVLKTEDCR
jgi:hypothetical protein